MTSLAAVGPGMVGHVGWATGADPVGSQSQRWIDAVMDRLRPWAAATSEFVSIEPRAPIRVTLRPGHGLPMTRDHHIVLPVRPGLREWDDPPELRALAHELVHAIVGRSPNMLLNEGLAVHVDATLRLAGPTWPFYELPPDRWVQLFRRERNAIELGDLIADAPSVAASPPARLAVGSFYLHAGSFTRFLIESDGWGCFWRRFQTGEVQPAGLDLTELQHRWHADLGGRLGQDDLRRRNRSLVLAGLDLPASR